MVKLAPPRCILFDLDGTLVDSVADISASANFVREGLGMAPLPDEEITRYVGDGAPRLMQRALAGRYDAPVSGDGHDLEAALHAFRAHYHDHCLVHTQPYPGVLETLASLHPLPMAIVSNKPEPMCATIADGLDLVRYLGSVVGARPQVPVKPDPALLLAALDEIGIEAVDDSVWMVGDSGNDIRAARAIGASAIAVSWGLTDRALLESFEPDAMLDGFPELSRLAG